MAEITNALIAEALNEAFEIIRSQPIEELDENVRKFSDGDFANILRATNAFSYEAFAEFSPRLLNFRVIEDANKENIYSNSRVVAFEWHKLFLNEAAQKKDFTCLNATGDIEECLTRLRAA